MLLLYSVQVKAIFQFKLFFQLACTEGGHYFIKINENTNICCSYQLESKN